MQHETLVAGAGGEWGQRQVAIDAEAAGAAIGDAAAQQVGGRQRQVGDLEARLQRRFARHHGAEVQRVLAVAAGEGSGSRLQRELRHRLIAGFGLVVVDFRLRGAAEQRVAVGRADGDLQIGRGQRTQRALRQSDGEVGAGLAGRHDDEAGRQGAAEGRGRQIGRIRRGDRPGDDRIGAGRAGQVGGVGDRGRAGRTFHHVGRRRGDAECRDRRRWGVDDGGLGDDAGLIDIQVVQQRVRIAGDQQVHHRRGLLVRIGDAGLDHLLLGCGQDCGRQVADIHRIRREVRIGEQAGALARQVVEQRGGRRHPPGVGKRAIEVAGTEGLRQDGAVGQLEIVCLAGVGAPQALDRPRPVAGTQGQAGVDVAVIGVEADVHHLAGAPAHLVAVDGGLGDRPAAGQADRLAVLGEREGCAVDPHRLGAIEADGDAVGADLCGELGDDADGRTGRPGLQAHLHLERIAGLGGLGEDELALGLEVVIEAVEGGDVHVTPGDRGRQRCRRRRGRGGDGADHVDGLVLQHALVAGGVGAGRGQHDLFAVGADRAGVQRDDRAGVGAAVGDAAEGVQAAVAVFGVAADGEAAAQQVGGRAGGSVQRLQVGGQRAAVLLGRTQVERVNTAGLRQRAGAADLADRRGGVVVHHVGDGHVDRAEGDGAETVDAGAVRDRGDDGLAGVGAGGAGGDRHRQAASVAGAGGDRDGAAAAGERAGDAGQGRIEGLRIAVRRGGVGHGQELGQGVAGVQDDRGRAGQRRGGLAIDGALHRDRAAADVAGDAIAGVGLEVEVSRTGLDPGIAGVQPGQHVGAVGGTRRELVDVAAGVGGAAVAAAEDIEIGAAGGRCVGDAECVLLRRVLPDVAEVYRAGGVDLRDRVGFYGAGDDQGLAAHRL